MWCPNSIFFFHFGPLGKTVPARLHQSGETLEEACISFLFQVIKHFLGNDKSGRGVKTLIETHWFADKDKTSNWPRERWSLTCWTCTLPPFRIEIPSLRVHVTMGPRRPGGEKWWRVCLDLQRLSVCCPSLLLSICSPNYAGVCAPELRPNQWVRPTRLTQIRKKRKSERLSE